MITVEEEYEELNDLLFKREQEYGDSDVIMIAGLLSGHTGQIYRTYVFEKLHAVHTPRSIAGDTLDILCPECGRPQIEHKAGMLDALAMRRVRRALQEHADNPVMFLAKISKNAWA